MMSLDEVDHRVELVAAELPDALGADDDERLVGAGDRRYAVRAVCPVAGWPGDGQRVLPAPLVGPLDGVQGRPGVDREGCRRSFPPESYARAQARFEDPERRNARAPSRTYPLRGRLRCKQCGAGMVGQSVQRGRYF